DVADVAEHVRMHRLGWNTNARNRVIPRQCHCLPKHPGQHVNVLVAVRVRDGNAGLPNFPDLGIQLATHLRASNLSAIVSSRELRDAGMESAIAVDEAWHLAGVEHRALLDEGEVHTNAQPGERAADLDRLLERGSTRHQRSRREDALRVRAADAFVDLA